MPGRWTVVFHKRNFYKKIPKTLFKIQRNFKFAQEIHQLFSPWCCVVKLSANLPNYIKHGAVGKPQTYAPIGCNFPQSFQFIGEFFAQLNCIKKIGNEKHFENLNLL